MNCHPQVSSSNLPDVLKTTSKFSNLFRKHKYTIPCMVHAYERTFIQIWQFNCCHWNNRYSRSQNIDYRLKVPRFRKDSVMD